MTSRFFLRSKFALFAAAALVCLILVGAAVIVSPKTATADESHFVVKGDGLKWMPFIGASQKALVSGEPSQPGEFVMRVRAPAGTVIPAHWHPATENLTILEGRFAVGMGDAFDASKLTVMEQGDFVQMPAKMHHFATAVTDTVVQVHGTGPFSVTFVNPADDPRPKQ